jgi:hypothetical protein
VGHGHGHDREHERSPTAQQIADAAEDEAAQRSYQEPGREGTECGDQGHCGRGGRKELRRDDGGEIAVDREVVPLHRITDEPRQDEPAPVNR